MPLVETIAAQNPDVIVGSTVGVDAVTPEVYAQLSAIAPTIVLDHSSPSWQDVVPVSSESAGVFGDASLFFVNATDEQTAGYRTARPVLGAHPRRSR